MSTAMLQTITLAAEDPFDFRQSLGFLCCFPATAGEQRTTADEMVKALRVSGRTVVARVTAAPGSVRADLHADAPLPQALITAVADRISFFLSLGDDLTGFYALGRQDPVFVPVLDRLHGYHQVKFPSPLENLVWAILAQRNPLPVAAKTKQALIDAFPGNRLTVGGTTYAAFPDLDQLTALSRTDLGALVRNERKAGQLHGALQAWRDADETFLRTGPYDQVRDLLLGLPGVGPWSAAFILIRGLGRMERLAYEKALLTTASRLYGRPVTERELRALAERYGSDQGYWGHYLRAAG